MNVRLLRKVQKQIKEEPRRLDMGLWAKRFINEDISFYYDDLDSVPPCRTMGCISGWAQIVSGAKPGIVARLSRSSGFERGAKVLGLTEEQANRLFYLGNWPKRFATRYSKYYMVQDRKKRADATIARIDHFIKTKGEE